MTPIWGVRGQRAGPGTASWRVRHLDPLQVTKERRNVASERHPVVDGFREHILACEPLVDEPRVLVAVSRRADRDRARHRHVEVTRDLRQPLGLLAHLGNGPRDPWESDAQVVAQAEDRVVGAGGRGSSERQPSKLGKLVSEERSDEVGIDRYLVAVEAPARRISAHVQTAGKPAERIAMTRSSSKPSCAPAPIS